METQLKEHPEEIQLTENQEIQQILGSPPGWILRWGILIVLLSIIGLLTIAWFVKFPDIIPSRIVLMTENPPVRLFSRIEGKLSEILTTEGQEVKAGELIAVLENTANWKEVLELENFLEKMESNSASTQLPQDLDLGSLQNSFSTLSQKLQEYKYISNFNITTEKVEAIRQQISNMKKLNLSLEGQIKTLKDVAQLSMKNVDRAKTLLEAEVGSLLDVENAEAQYLKDQRTLETINAQILNNDIRIQELEVSILETRQSENDAKSNKSFGIQEDFERLKTDIQLWKQQYLIESPIAGKVSMPRILTTQQFVKVNEELITIIPQSGAGKIIGKAFLPFEGAGKVNVGSRVNIRLDGYPFQEYGSINAGVFKIAGVPKDGGYLLEIALPEDLKTTYGKTIPFKQEMQGTANIISEDRSILDRIFDRILSLLKNQ